MKKLLLKPDDYISSLVNIDVSDYHCITENKGFWYYDAMRADKTSGPTIYRQLVESAKDKIYVWDVYLTENDADLFRNISNEVNLTILTRKNDKDKELQNNRQLFNFVEGMKNFQKKQGFGLKIACICTSSHQKISKQKVPHDRFLFIDDRVFVVGSSLYYHSVESDSSRLNSISTTAITEIFDESNKNIIRNDFNKYLDKTNERYKKYVEIICDEPGSSFYE